MTSLQDQMQGILTEGEGSVQLTSRLNSMFCKKNIVVDLKLHMPSLQDQMQGILAEGDGPVQLTSWFKIVWFAKNYICRFKIRCDKFTRPNTGNPY